MTPVLHDVCRLVEFASIRCRDDAVSSRVAFGVVARPMSNAMNEVLQVVWEELNPPNLAA